MTNENEVLIEAIRVVVRAQSASEPLVQRRCYVGFANASHLLERMEQVGVVGPKRVEARLPREVLVQPEGLDEVLASVRAAEQDSEESR